MDEDLLRVYYTHLFPASHLSRWLSYDRTLVHREFSFTIKDDIYIRYLSFENSSELKQSVVKKLPHKIDIGAIYNISPALHNTVRPSGFIPKQRELVFDIDLDDYASVSSSTDTQAESSIWSGGKWIFMSTAIKLLTEIMHHDFGYEQLLWVFSGRRGVHLWVCDYAARILTDSQRQALISYVSMIVNNKVDNVTKVMNYPGFAKFKNLLYDSFFKIGVDTSGQNLFKNEIDYSKIIAMIPDDNVRTTLLNAWKVDSNAMDTNDEPIGVIRWRQLQATVKDAAAQLKKSKQYKQSDDILASLDHIVLVYTYPRLDVNVSIHRNHLLKSPFVIHPKTGKVCVPIWNVESCESFDPDSVPTLSGLIKSFDQNTCEDVSPVAKRPKLEESSEMDQFKKSLDDFEKYFLLPLEKRTKELENERKQRTKMDPEKLPVVPKVELSW